LIVACIYINTPHFPHATMPSTSTPAPSSTASGDVSAEDKRNNATSQSPSEESDKLPTVYDPPPASWFFARGSRNNNNHTGEKKDLSETQTQRGGSSFKSHSSDGTNVRTHHSPANSNTDLGMVSDNEEEEDEREGFNFIAISNSLLMAGRSFEQMPKSPSEDGVDDARSSDNSGDNHHGVLIVGGIASDNSEDSSPAPVLGSNTNTSVLTIPGSDSLPSEIGSINHQDDDEDDQNFSEDPFIGENPIDDGLAEGSYQDQQGIKQDFPPLVHRFLKNLQRTRRLRKVSDASDENGGIPSSGVSVVRNNEEDISVAWTVDTSENQFRRSLLRFFSWRYSIPSLGLVLFATVFACHSFATHQRNEREAWAQRMREQQVAMARLLDEKETLRQEMEILMEEAFVATTRADSLAKEQERLLLQREEAEKAEKERIRLLQEQEQRKQQERQNQKRRRQQPWRSGSSNDESFGWFFDDTNEECSNDKDGGSTAFTIVDNCWIKAKADINIGSCGGETKDYFKGVWNGLWEDWFYDESTLSDALEKWKSESQGEKEQNSKPLKDHDNDYYRIDDGEDQQDREGNYEEGRNYHYQDDTYYPPQDPLKDIFSAIQSAGNSFVTKLSNLMSDEVENTQKTARDMEETVRRKYSEASQTMENAMEVAKEDMRELSKEALSALRVAVQKSSSSKKNQNKNGETGASHKNPHSSSNTKEGVNSFMPMAQVTREALYDTATAVVSLSKSWQEFSKSVSPVGKKTSQ